MFAPKAPDPGSTVPSRSATASRAVASMAIALAAGDEQAAMIGVAFDQVREMASITAVEPGCRRARRSRSPVVRRSRAQRGKLFSASGHVQGRSLPSMFHVVQNVFLLPIRDKHTARTVRDGDFRCGGATGPVAASRRRPKRPGARRQRIVTASPKSGCDRSAIPNTAGSPMWTGAPCIVG